MVRLNTNYTVAWDVSADFDDLQHLHEVYAKLHTTYDLEGEYELYTYAQQILQKMQSAHEDGEDASLTTAEYHILRTMIQWYREEFSMDEDREEFLEAFDNLLQDTEPRVVRREVLEE